MSTILSIDFETRSRIDLKDRGLDVYARDHSTEIICIAAGFDSGHVEVWAPKNVPNWALDHAANKGRNLRMECGV